MALSKVGSNQIDSAASLTVSGNVSADGGTIKLDGNYPTGTNNVALGDAALGGGSLSGGSNVAIGTSALDANTSGTTNIAIGVNALGANTTASDNVAVGHSTLKLNTTGASNVAVGYEALDANTTAPNNTAVGYAALTANTTGDTNVAVGKDSMKANTTGTNNTALGPRTLQANTTAVNNVAVGDLALGANTTGASNTAVGTNAASTNTTSNGITAVGENSLSSATGAYNTAIGTGAGTSITSGAKNTIVGGFQGNQSNLDIRTSSNNIVISDGDGNPRFEYVSAIGQIVIGRGVTYSNVGANSGAIQHYNRDQTQNPSLHPAEDDFTDLGRSSNRYDDIHATNGTIQTSDSRVKENITDSDLGLDFINRLSPKSYTMVGKTRTHYGLVAQDVRTVLGDISKSEADFAGFVDYNMLPADDGQRDLLALRYDEFISPLIQAVKDLKTELDAAKARIAALEAG